MNTMGQKGSVFILFLWVLILLSSFAFSASFRTRLATKIEAYDSHRFELHYDFLTGVNLARFFIESDQETSVDFMGDDWYGMPKDFVDSDFSKRFDLEISDEESKLDLNRASEPLLLKFFDVLGKNKIKLETDPKDLVGSVLAWRGQTAASGQSTIGFEHKRAPFESTQELYMIQKISPHDVKTLLPFVTVRGALFGSQMRVNLNTVHPFILEALIYHLSGGEFDKRTLLDQIERFRNIDAYRSNKQESELDASEAPPQVFRQSDLNPQTMIQKLGLPNSPEMVQLVNQLVSFLTVDSQYFRVRIQSQTSKKNSFVLDAVLGLRPIIRVQSVVSTAGSLSRAVGQPVTMPLEILSWREGIAS